VFDHPHDRGEGRNRHDVLAGGVAGFVDECEVDAAAFDGEAQVNQLAEAGGRFGPALDFRSFSNAQCTKRPRSSRFSNTNTGARLTPSLSSITLAPQLR
jgi:hypothetical protein